MGIFYLLLSCVVGFAIGVAVRWLYAKYKLTSAEQEAVRVRNEAQSKAEAEAKELMLETRETLQKEQQRSQLHLLQTLISQQHVISKF